MDMHIYSWGWKSDSNCIEQAHSYLAVWSMGEYSVGKQHSKSCGIRFANWVIHKSAVILENYFNDMIRNQMSILGYCK
jgi:hypothetical protein